MHLFRIQRRILAICAPGDTNFCEDAFVLKVDPTGALLWSTYYGAGVRCCTVAGLAIAVDSDSNVYVAGNSSGAFDLVQMNAIQPTTHGGQDVFLLTLSADGSQVLFGSYFGGSANEIPTSLALDKNNVIYLGGYTNSVDLPTTPGAVQSANAGPGYRQGFFASIATRQ